MSLWWGNSCRLKCWLKCLQVLKYVHWNYIHQISDSMIRVLLVTAFCSKRAQYEAALISAWVESLHSLWPPDGLLGHLSLDISLCYFIHHGFRLATFRLTTWILHIPGKHYLKEAHTHGRQHASSKVETRRWNLPSLYCHVSCSKSSITTSSTSRRTDIVRSSIDQYDH